MSVRAISLLVLSFAAASATSRAQPLTGPEFPIDAQPGHAGFQPSAAYTPSGDLIVTWAGAGLGFYSDVFARRLTRSGDRIGAPEFQVNTYSTGTQGYAKVGVDGAGRFVVVWESYGQDGDKMGVFARRFDSTGTPLDPVEQQVNTFTTSHQLDPVVGVFPSGEFVVAWWSDGADGSSYGIAARRFGSDGMPLDADEFVVNTFTTSAQRHPSIAIAPSGDFIVAWEDFLQEGFGLGVFARRFDHAGQPLDATEFQVNTYTTSMQYAAAAGMDDSGNFVIAWKSLGQDGSGFGVFARRFASDASPLDPVEFQVNTYTTSSQTQPSIAVAASGEFVVAWMNEDVYGSGRGIFGRRFDRTGLPLDSPEFQASTFTGGNQRSPAVGAGPFGDFVVAWESFSSGGPGIGSFARRVCLDTDLDGICDSDDIIVTGPLGTQTVDCRTPGDKLTRPVVTWNRGNYDRFRVQISWDPGFAKEMRITSGRRMIRRSQWRPGVKRWIRACANAGSEIHVRVFGVDGDAAKQAPDRRTFSNETAPVVVH